MSGSFRGQGRRGSNTRVGRGRREFGQARSSSSGRFGSQNQSQGLSQTDFAADATSSAVQVENTRVRDEIDVKMGFDRYEAGPARVGWLINMHTTAVEADSGQGEVAAVNFYFLGDDGENFKVTYVYDPYFLVGCKVGQEAAVEEYLRRRYDGLVKKLSRTTKEDLDIRTFIHVAFHNINDLLAVRKELLPLAEHNRKAVSALDIYADVTAAAMELDSDFVEVARAAAPDVEVSTSILDLREYDVPYHVRVAIDCGIRIGKWYTAEAVHGDIALREMPERLARPDPVVLAFDIETTKLPLKFPDVLIDRVMMISYMIDGAGFLITNREIVSEDIGDFEYTPKPEFPGVFTIFNEPSERAVLERFFEHVRDCKPTIIATYNGDFFDWPFVEGRALHHGLDMYYEIGFKKDSEDEYKSAYCAHMDCFRWVKRDSYLPQGSQGLKAVTTAKLGYDPIELDPELMTKYASERPQTLSEYSVSDAVATYYLYMKYVHPFIFSLCNIIPLNPDETLRKGTGTLCEMLLMVQAYQHNIVLPNKHKEPDEHFYEGHLVESETYVGGHVESLEAGVFRSDIPVDFAVDPAAVQELLDDLDGALRFTVEVENGRALADVANYAEVRAAIAAQLEDLRDRPARRENPMIYHLDVSSMYPNIMITNRLQPDSIIDEADCAACDFNRPGKNCDRRLPWMWRGEYSPSHKDEYNMIRRTLEAETFPGRHPKAPPRAFAELPRAEQSAHVKKRLAEYSRKIYHKIKETKTVEKEAIVCQRENPFYVNTVRDFRDRRYEYKNKQKDWKRQLERLPKTSAREVDEARKMVVLFDSLQLAHKVILNSFYGYVMRKGSRWYSMAMAGVTCLTGATIIQMARALVERLGKPLELDTDGIWCIFPAGFPENFRLQMAGGKDLHVSYPCMMLNHKVHGRFTNRQYQSLADARAFRYDVREENSIYFEVDGPYRAMILPTSKEEDKNLKKRYAVFNDDGSLAELKGFEIKRRGELKLIKIFQSQIFRVFLEGRTLDECYGAVAKVANRWLDVVDSKGYTLADDELIDLISENKSMSRALTEYGTLKSTSISTAKRLGEFLGDQMVKDKGLACRFIISARPASAPVTERAIPVAIFAAEPAVRAHFLRRWLKDPGLAEFDPRDIIDWGYYRERLGSVIQKIISIPAALQHVPNPVPRIQYPDWLVRRLSRLENPKQQASLDGFGVRLKAPIADVTNRPDVGDIEDGGVPGPKLLRPVARVTKRRGLADADAQKENAFASLPPVPPGLDDDYADWLRYAKAKWKAQRQARQRRRFLFGAARPAGVGSFFRDQAEATFSKPWQVLQVRPTDAPGELRAWLLIDGYVQTARVAVRRQIYVELRGAALPDVDVVDCDVEKVHLTLPDGRQSPRLFRVSMPEEHYQAQLAAPAGLFRHPAIAAVYESKIDLVTQFLLTVGNACQIDTSRQGVLGDGLRDGFDLRHLTPLERPYLADGLRARVVLLYHIASKDRTIYALFTSADHEAHLFVYDATKQFLPPMDALYRELHAQHAAPGLFAQPEAMDVHVNKLATLRQATAAAYKRIRAVAADHAGRVVVALLSPDRARVEADMPALRDLPIVELRHTPADNAMPALDWRLPVARRILLTYFGAGARVDQALRLAQYGGLPLCNVGSARDVIDVTFARRLRAAGVVLWWSPTAFPDVGGAELDRAVLQTEDFAFPAINNPGSYHSVCIELAVQNLTVNTVLTFALLNELEAGDAAPLTENGAATPAIAVLRSMVKQWWEDAVAENDNADVMVAGFIGWVSDPMSRMYDPTLQYHVQNLSKKAFLQLVAEFRRVGARVVFAEPHRLLIQTTKAAVANAYSYAHYVVKSVRSKSLFHFLDLEIVEYWDYLLWMDSCNYGGMACQDVTADERQPLTLYLNWHVASFLPPLLRAEFQTWAEEFVRAMHAAKHDDGATLSTPRPTQLQQARADGDYHGKGVLDGLHKPLRRRVQQLLRLQTDAVAAADEFRFPVLAGSHLQPTNGALELVKALCAVFGLAADLNIELRQLRRDLLALFDVKEFSDAGVFRNPSASLKLVHVCASCGLENELDLCKDDLRDDRAAFCCRFCAHELDRLVLEEKLVSDVAALLHAYQVQDLHCSRCKQVRGDNLSAHCGCSGAWALTVRADDLRKKLATYAHVSKFFSLRMLASFVESVGHGLVAGPRTDYQQHQCVSGHPGHNPIHAGPIGLGHSGRWLSGRADGRLWAPTARQRSRTTGKWAFGGADGSATILKLLDVVHPAAKVLVDISRAQDAEVGDGTTSVTILAGELMRESKAFVEEGVSTHIVAKGYRKAAQLAVNKIKELAVTIDRGSTENFRDLLEKCAATVMSSKIIHRNADLFTKMAVDAVLTLDQDDLDEKLIGIKKITGGGMEDSQFINGVAFKKTFSYAGFEQQPKQFDHPSIICLNVELELKAEKDNAEVRVEEVSEYQAVVDAEWKIIFDKLEAIYNTGAKVVLSKLPIGDLATQFFADRDVFCAGRVAADDLDRVIQAVGGSIQSTTSDIKPQYLGTCDYFEERQIGGERFNVFTGCPKAKTCTLILRGGADQFIAEVERSLHDAIMIVKRAVKNNAIVAGGGACEMEISKYLRDYSRTIAGKQQLVIGAFARALEVIPRQLCDNAGFDATDLLNRLRMRHARGETWAGVDFKTEDISDNMEKFVWEPALVKINAIQSAAEAACLILSVDETVKNEESAAPQQGMPMGGGNPMGMRGRGRGMPRR
ncbi:TCP-1/cpn60 chaperonin family-domain-containing protein [Dipodascopsis tothii]|uniref:TCP-1/cpn60 chaperonin family-domain-containing protein n=1 Tax=Dipodascopsis tothii TaxID=44089 RepID=UPI0034CF2E4C